MPIPSEINDLVQGLNRELNLLEREATDGLALARTVLNRFPNNFTVTQLFAFLNTAIFFVETSRRKIQNRLELFAGNDVVTSETVQEVGEDLANELGRVLETQTRVDRIKNRLQELQ